MQKRHLVTKQQYGKAYPRVHGLVYSVSDGILKKIHTDESEMYRKYSSVYGLFGPPLPPTSKPVEACPVASAQPAATVSCTCGQCDVAVKN